MEHNEDPILISDDQLVEMTLRNSLITREQVRASRELQHSYNARYLGGYDVRDFYEAQRTKDRALIQNLLNALDRTEALDNGCPLPTWQNKYDEMCDMRSNALAATPPNPDLMDTEKRYRFDLGDGATATFNTEKPDSRTIEILRRVLELAEKYDPKKPEQEKMVKDSGSWTEQDFEG